MSVSDYCINYRAEILANAEVLFPSQDPKLITIFVQNEGYRTLIISSTTGETLLEQDGGGNDLDILSSKIQQLLRDKVQEGLKGSASGRSGGSDDDVEQKLRHENRELYRQIGELHREKEVLLEHLKDAKVELAEFKLAEANRRNEELQKRIAVLERERQGMDTPTTSAQSVWK
jgi:hypothetical protein